MIRKLYIVRHGIAVNLEEAGAHTDAQRTLSDAGRDKTRRVAAFLNELHCCPDLLVTSPYPRAAETAEILAEELGYGEAPVTLDALTPVGSLEETLRYLKRCARESVMVVGHMPDLAMLASILVGGHDDLDFTFKKAGAARLSLYGTVTPGGATLDWLMQPRQMLRLDSW